VTGADSVRRGRQAATDFFFCAFGREPCKVSVADLGF
jgi:hypothetical protein